MKKKTKDFISLVFFFGGEREVKTPTKKNTIKSELKFKADSISLIFQNMNDVLIDFHSHGIPTI